MKNIYFTLCLMMVALVSHATIIHVDKNPNRPAGYFDDIAAAVNSASAGDSIYIYPSNTPYGNITITKKLHLFGFGYQLPLSGVSQLGSVLLDTTSTPHSNPSGSTIQGLTISYLEAKKPNINNIKVYGNYFSSSEIKLTSGCSNWEFKNNLIRNYININYASSMVISNNVFYGGNSNSIYNSNSSTVIISNNLFMNWQYFRQVYNATVNNNIFICANDQVQSQMSNNVFTNNLSWRSSLSPYPLPPTGNTGSGNKSNVDPQFETANAYGYFDYIKDYHLKSSSPGKNAGTDGTDVGPYGGTNPFIFGGAFTIPSVTELVVKNPVVNQGTSINIQLKAKKADL